MCELFAMSCREKSTLNYSLNEFAKHGGTTHSNKSGWGIAYYESRDALLIKEPEPAADSPWVKFISEQNLQSDCVIAHVRLATIGTPVLRNTHPFKRQLGNCAHVFAHNGTLKGGLHDLVDATELIDQPIGETDSELAFCLLLERMRNIWGKDEPPAIESRIETFTQFCHEMAALGSANFIYTDGDVLYAHGHRRIYEENGKFSEPRSPGLSMRICSTCQEGEEHWECNGLNIELGNPKTILLASVPLGTSGWRPLPEQTVVAISKGELISQNSSCRNNVN